MIRSLFKIVSLVLVLAMTLTGCASMNAATKMAAYGGNPQTERISLPTEEQLLTCYGTDKWHIDRKYNHDGRVAVKVATVSDVSGKVTYGDDGTGSILPTENASTAIAALDLAMRPGSPVKWVDGSEAVVKMMKDEVLLGLRDTKTNKDEATPVDYYLFGNTVSVDSVMVAVNEIAAYGVGGGPRQERWSFDMNLRFVRPNGDGLASSSVYNQYVQQELRAFIGSVVGGGSAKTVLTAQAESVVRGKLQSLMRPMIYLAVADLLGRVPGAPTACINMVDRFFKGHMKPRPVTVAAYQNSPAVDLRRKPTAVTV